MTSGSLRYLTLPGGLSRTGQKMAVLNVSGNPEFGSLRETQLDSFAAVGPENVCRPDLHFPADPSNEKREAHPVL